MSFWLGAILIGACAFVAALAAWWFLPIRWAQRFRAEIPNAKDRAEIEDNFRKTIGQLIAGAAIILGAGLAYLQTQDTIKGQQKQTQDTINAQQKQTQDTLNAQIRQTQKTITSQLISKAVDLLGEKQDRLKQLGGIYTLENVMDAGEYYQTGLDILCGFVRVTTENRTEQGPPAPDVEAVLTFLTRDKEIGGKVMLADARIPYAVLQYTTWISPNLNRIHLNSSTLTTLKLIGGAQLIEADLSNAKTFNIILTGANLTKINLTGAELYNANLTDAHLTDANLTGADLANADLTNADLTRTNLTGAKLGNARNLTPDQLTKACSNGATQPPPSMETLTLKSCP
jgi:uncharacterized protein YjbI with pentapeptide repeats